MSNMDTQKVGHSSLGKTPSYAMDRNDFESALSVLQALLARYWLDDPEARLLALGTTLRALGGCGEFGDYDQVFGVFMELLKQMPETPRHAQAFLSAARGALSLRRWHEAESLLTRAVQSAGRTHQPDTILQAEQILIEVRQRRSAPAPTRRTRPYGEVARLTVMALQGSGGHS